MKKISFILLSLLFAGGLWAQEPVSERPQRTPEEEALTQTTRLVRELSITDSVRFDTIYKMHLKYARLRQRGLTRAENMQRLQDIYAELLKNPDEVVKGTVKELAEKYNVSIMTMTGFLDGIDESLVTPNSIDEMEEDTVVSLGFDKEKLYKNMVAAEADWLYNLEEWNDIFDEDKRKALYKEQKASTTIVKEAKVYPNDPCPCGSGKKYKKCCGKK